MSNKLRSLVKSRRFWVAVATLVLVVTDGLGLGLTSEQVIGATVLAGSWIVGDTLRETT
jgi:hypothetical protein